MNKLLRGYDWSKWIHGLFAAAIGGGASAATGALGLLAVDSEDFNFGTLRFYQMGMAIFAGGALVPFFAYLKVHPVPEIISETYHETVQRTAIPMRGTGDGTVGNEVAREQTVTKTTEEKVEVKDLKE